jgi:hypothetical protein
MGKPLGRFGVIVLLVAGRGAQAAPDAAPAAPAQPTPAPHGAEGVRITGTVVLPDGKPVADVAVFAVTKGSSQIRRLVRSGGDGSFAMILPSVVHDFGVMSARWQLVKFVPGERGQIRLTVVRAFPDIDPASLVRTARRTVMANVTPLDSGGTVAPSDAPRAPGDAAVGLLSGTVQDETGVGLAGVRILAVDAVETALVSVAQTDAAGKYRLLTLARPTRLIVYAPGLLLDRVRRPGAGKVDFVLAIDAVVENIVLRSGRTLSFRIEDSMMPEAYPPRAVAGALLQDYGIDFNTCFCPGDLLNTEGPSSEQYRNACLWSAGRSCSKPSSCPVTVWARQCKMPRYWWLRMLQMNPPNPTRRENIVGDNTMWWYDTIRAMQAEDARVAAAPGRRAPSTGPSRR